MCGEVVSVPRRVPLQTLYSCLDEWVTLRLAIRTGRAVLDSEELSRICVGCDVIRVRHDHDDKEREDCRDAGCAFRVKADDTHNLFAELLRSARPTEPLLKLFREVVLRVWDERVQAAQAEKQAGKKDAAKLEEEKRSILTLMKRSADNLILLGELEKDFARVDGELSLSRVAGEPCELEAYDKEKVVDFCIDVLRRADELWRKWPVQGQNKLQRLVLPHGVSYDELRGCRTPRLSLVYGLCANPHTLETTMAGPRGIEPRFSG